MNWQTFLWWLLGFVVTGILSFAGERLVAWLNTKIKNEKLLAIINKAISTVQNVVQATYQTFVESLKAEGKFDKEAQKKALNQAVTAAKAQLSTEFTNYLTENNIDVEEWIVTQVESTIYELKK